MKKIFSWEVFIALVLAVAYGIWNVSSQTAPVGATDTEFVLRAMGGSLVILLLGFVLRDWRKRKAQNREKLASKDVTIK